MKTPAIPPGPEYLTCPHCGGVKHGIFHNIALFFNSGEKDLAKEAERIAGELHRGTATGVIDRQMAAMVAGKLSDAVVKGYGKSFTNIEYGTHDYEMLAALESNVFQFSGAKNYQQLRDMTKAIADANGQVRPFKQYLDDALKINRQYNVTWLRTEYDTAIGSAQMAGRWAEFNRNKADMPLLRYQTSGDARVRDEHRKLDGVTKDMDDPFWDVYYPPNGWNCRCDVLQLAGGAETPDSRIQYPPVQSMFRTNLAKSGLAFPKNHPYYNGIPAEVLKEANAVHARVNRQSARDWAQKNIPKYGKIELIAENEIFKTLTVRRADIRSITGHSHKYQPDVARLTKRLDDLLFNSDYFDWSYDNGRHGDVIKWYYFRTKIKGEYSYIHVKHTIDNEYRVHCVRDRFETDNLVKTKKHS